jgi:hypothetical protein
MKNRISINIKVLLAIAASFFCCMAVQAQNPQGIGKPAPMDPPAKAVVQTPEPRVLTEQDKANAAKSMAEYQKAVSNGVKPAESQAIRPKQPHDAVDPRENTPVKE